VGYLTRTQVRTTHITPVIARHEATLRLHPPTSLRGGTTWQSHGMMVRITRISSGLRN
jgi:hypothetical protein